MSLEQTVANRPRQSPLMRYLQRFEEGRLIRAAFFGMLIGTASVLALDFSDLLERNGLMPDAASATAVTVPILPPAVDSDNAGGGVDPRQFIRTNEAMLRDPMRFILQPGGTLEAIGSVDVGSALRFAEEVELRGEYVRRVTLNSPGGSLDDAMAMARLMREKGFATEVEDGALCASSCPLMLAGGATRIVDEKGAVGLHQFYASNNPDTPPAQAMADAQVTTARISRLLIELGVDPALWLHALDTPPRALYYLSAEEMAKYRLVTKSDQVAAGG
ncbi:MAG: hypothetical protein KF849_11175 [Rhizobiaceae bacterium]|nr:hypothetical protein [Rhizobiaceae bacterium]